MMRKCNKLPKLEQLIENTKHQMLMMWLSLKLQKLTFKTATPACCENNQSTACGAETTDTAALSH
jgi:hypothetical protein